MLAMCRKCRIKNFRALMAHVPLLPGSLTRKLYRKKIPENTLKVPGVPGSKSGIGILDTKERILTFPPPQNSPSFPLDRATHPAP